MRLRWLAAALAAFCIGSALAQTVPPFDPGSAPTADVWNRYFASKQDMAGTKAADNAAAGNLGEFLQSFCQANVSSAVTVTIASPAVFTWASSPFQYSPSTASGAGTGRQDMCPLQLTTSGALPTGLATSTQYWVIPSTISGNNFSVATTIANALAGTAVNTSGSQSGTQTATEQFNLTTATTGGFTALPLTAGDWDVQAACGFLAASTTVVSFEQCGIAGSISVTGNQASRSALDLAYTSGGANIDVLATPNVRASEAATTPIYATGQMAFATSTAFAAATLSARRAR